MQQSPMHQFHLDYGAQMVEYVGWEMPIRYTSIVEEHRQVRNSGGIFDVSHMGRVKFRGRHARKLLERLCSRKIYDMQIGQVRYSLMCNETGGVLDDVLVYKLDEDEFLVVVNASNRAKLMPHFEAVRAAGDLTVKIEDETLKTAMVAIQGPNVIDMIATVSKEVPALKRYRFTIKNLMILKLMVSRTGYTGEDGVEVILPSNAIGMAMKLLLKDVKPGDENAVIKPAGLGARDSLRLEAGMPLYGHELGEEINALSCGIDFAIALDKDEHERGEVFIGQEALKATRDAGGPPQKVIGLKVEGKRTPRQGMAVFSGETQVGSVTSGCMSPTFEYPIAMALVDRAATEEGLELTIDMGRDRTAATVTKLPFYTKPKKA